MEKFRFERRESKETEVGKDGVLKPLPALLSGSTAPRKEKGKREQKRGDNRDTNQMKRNETERSLRLSDKASSTYLQCQGSSIDRRL